MEDRHAGGYGLFGTVELKLSMVTSQLLANEVAIHMQNLVSAWRNRQLFWVS
jgi:hypothetical protein